MRILKYLCLFVAGFSSLALGQDRVWTNTTGTALWSSTAPWADGNVPDTASENAFITSQPTGAMTVQIGYSNTLSVGSVTVSNTTANTEIIDLQMNGITNRSFITVNGDMILHASGTGRVRVQNNTAAAAIGHVSSLTITNDLLMYGKVSLTNIPTKGGFNVQVGGRFYNEADSLIGAGRFQILMTFLSDMPVTNNGAITFFYPSGNNDPGVKRGVVIANKNTFVNNGSYLTGGLSSTQADTDTLDCSLVNNGTLLCTNAANGRLRFQLTGKNGVTNINNGLWTVISSATGGYYTLEVATGSVQNAGTLAVFAKTNATTLTMAQSGAVFTNTPSGLLDVRSGIFSVNADGLMNSGTNAVQSGAVLRYRNKSGANTATLYNYGLIALTNSALDVGILTNDLGGVLSGSGTITGIVTCLNGSAIKPGAGSGTTGKLTISTNLNLGSGSETVLKLTGAGTNDSVAVSDGILTQGGALTVTNTTGFALMAGQTFDLFDGTLAGSFATTNLPHLDPGYFWITDNLGINGQIVVGQEGAMQALWQQDIQVTEGNAGATNVILTVLLTQAPGTNIVSVDYATFDGSATASPPFADYAAASGTLTFTGSQTSTQVVLAVYGDTMYESNEFFGVQLLNPVNLEILTTNAFVSINNDDTIPSVSIGGVQVVEGNSGTAPAVFPVTLSGPDGFAVTVNYTTQNGTATSEDNDYIPASGTLTIPVGVVSTSITVSVVGDTQSEFDERFTLVLSNPNNAVAGNMTGLGSILSDDTMDVDRFSYRMPVTFQGYTQAETLFDFPALVVLSNNVGNSGFDYTGFLSSQATDLRFTTLDNIELSYEIEKWNTGGVSYVWVRVGSLVDSNTTIVAWWGKKDLTQPAYTTNGTTWGSYEAVYHCATANTLIDSSPNKRHATVTGGGGTLVTDGAVNGALSKTNGPVYTYNLPDLNGDWTVSAWLRASSTQIEGVYFGAVAPGMRPRSTAIGWSFFDTADRRYGAWATNQWAYCTAVQDDAGNNLKLFFNGNPGVNASISTNHSVTTFDVQDAYIGDVDEARVYAGQRSAAWLWAEYMNMASNSAFNFNGPVEKILAKGTLLMVH